MPHQNASEANASQHNILNHFVEQSKATSIE